MSVVLLEPHVPVPDGARVLHEYRNGGRLVRLAGPVVEEGPPVEDGPPVAGLRLPAGAAVVDRPVRLDGADCRSANSRTVGTATVRPATSRHP